MKVTFSRFQYDRDGDIFDDAILLQFGENAMLRIRDEVELLEIIEQLQNIKKEISDMPF